MRITMLITTLTMTTFMLSTTSQAQTIPTGPAGLKMVPGKDGGWVPCNHPMAIESCTLEPLPPVDIATGCTKDFNPYEHPECAPISTYNKPGDPNWRFKIGKTYLHPYTALSVTIIGLLVNIHGSSVFIGETNQNELREFPSNSNPSAFAFYQER
jgi:hypothetical protein